MAATVVVGGCVALALVLAHSTASTRDQPALPALPAAQTPARPVHHSAEVSRTFPFPPDHADRPVRPGEVPSMYADGQLCSVGCRPYGARVGWPVAPIHAQHPLRAGLNELRPGSLHVGLDVQVADGTPVFAVQPGIARVLAPSGPDARVQVGNYIYWHIAPVVRSGEFVSPFKTMLGRVMHGYGHFAFSELGATGQYVNPLRPGGSVLEPLANHDRPVIGTPAVARDGQVVVGAYAPQSFVKRTTYLTPVLAPAAIAYRLYDRSGSAVTALHWALRGTHLEPFGLRRLIYAPGTREPGFACFARRSVCVPEWTYRVAGGFAPVMPTSLPVGRYRLTVYAWDWMDHATALDVPVTLTAHGWKPIDRFPKALLDGSWARAESAFGYGLGLGSRSQCLTACSRWRYPPSSPATGVIPRLRSQSSNIGSVSRGFSPS